MQVLTIILFSETSSAILDSAAISCKDKVKGRGPSMSVMSNEDTSKAVKPTNGRTTDLILTPFQLRLKL